MMELIYAAFSPSNLLLSVLLVLIMFYWLTVILGALDVNSIDVDLDVDVDVDIDVDVDVEVDVEVDAEIEAEVDADTEAGEVGGAGWFMLSLRFFNFGRLPFMVVMSLLILFMWSISVYCNHDGSIVNPNNSLILAGLLFVPNMFVSLFITKILTAPLVPVFAKLNTSVENVQVEGKVGILTTSVNKKGMGQMKAEIEGSTITVSIRMQDKLPIKKGEKVVVIEYLADEKIYIVDKIDHH